MALRRVAFLGAQGHSILAAASTSSQTLNKLLEVQNWLSFSALAATKGQIPSPTPQTHARYGLAVAAQQEADRYTLKVVTGNLRGAGSPTPAWLQLIGANGSTDKLIVGDTDSSSLLRGSVRTVVLQADKDIGQLRRVHVEKQATSTTDIGAGWFLQQVEVEGPDGERSVFPCNSWLGESDCGGISGPLERNLLPAVSEAEQLHPQPVSVSAAGLSIPHPDKVKSGAAKGVNKKGFGYGGEDAYFLCEGRNNIFGMGVADGVYMWREQGIDSGKMSRSLMQSAKQMIQAGYEDVFKGLQQAAQIVASERLEGSSTVCLLSINRSQGQLHAANLGDSGFLLLRGGDRGYEVKFRTNQLEHEFGRPFQLGHHAHANKVEDSELATFRVSKGDVIVMGSDGLFDNLPEHEIIQEVTTLTTAHAKPHEIVQRLVKRAFEASVDKHKTTPYSKAASEAFDMVYAGGKPDDITVLVALCE